MTTLSLAPVLDVSAAAPLRSLLLAHRGQDLDLDCALVDRVGGLCLQILLSAKLTWTNDGKNLRLIDVSAPCREALRLSQADEMLGVEA